MARKIALLASGDALDLDTDGPLLFKALEEAAIDFEVVAWDDPSVRWGRFAAVVVRATWDYFQRPEEFVEVLEAIDGATALHNPKDAMLWNIDKRYLREIADAGHPVVPTSYVAHLTPPTELGAALARLSSWTCGEVVVKPSVSAGSNDTYRLDATDGSAIAKAVQAIIDSDRVAMVQPYLAKINTYGERGVVYVNGEFDHAFAKKAQLTQGIQRFEGLFVPEEVRSIDLTDEEMAVADGVNRWLAARFGTLLYARIDLLPGDDGPVVVEVELIEPGLFFESDPASADRFAAALAEIG